MGWPRLLFEFQVPTISDTNRPGLYIPLWKGSGVLLSTVLASPNSSLFRLTVPILLYTRVFNPDFGCRRPVLRLKVPVISYKRTFD